MKKGMLLFFIAMIMTLSLVMAGCNATANKNKYTIKTENGSFTVSMASDVDRKIITREDGTGFNVADANGNITVEGFFVDRNYEVPSHYTEVKVNGYKFWVFRSGLSNYVYLTYLKNAGVDTGLALITNEKSEIAYMTIIENTPDDTDYTEYFTNIVVIENSQELTEYLNEDQAWELIKDGKTYQFSNGKSFTCEGMPYKNVENTPTEIQYELDDSTLVVTIASEFSEQEITENFIERADMQYPPIVQKTDQGTFIKGFFNGMLWDTFIGLGEKDKVYVVSLFSLDGETVDEKVETLFGSLLSSGLINEPEITEEETSEEATEENGGGEQPEQMKYYGEYWQLTDAFTEVKTAAGDKIYNNGKYNIAFKKEALLGVMEKRIEKRTDFWGSECELREDNIFSNVFNDKIYMLEVHHKEYDMYTYYLLYDEEKVCVEIQEIDNKQLLASEIKALIDKIFIKSEG